MKRLMVSHLPSAYVDADIFTLEMSSVSESTKITSRVSENDGTDINLTI